MSEVDDWIETLAGRGKGGNEDAAALRRAAQAGDGKLAGKVPAQQDLRFAKLVTRLEQEGLLASRRPARARRTWLPLGAAAAVILAVAVGVVLDGLMPPTLQPYTSENFFDAPQLRGRNQYPLHFVPTGRWFAMVVEQVDQFGWPHRLREDGEDLVLEFYIPADAGADDAARRWLSDQGIQRPADGWVVLRSGK